MVHDFDAVIGEVDVINMLRVQFERIKSSQFPTVREFTRFFGLTPERFRRCKPGVFVMHPGPMNRGIEISSDIADGPQSGILTQVTNGLAVRMAVLYLVTQAIRMKAATKPRSREGRRDEGHEILRLSRTQDNTRVNERVEALANTVIGALHRGAQASRPGIAGRRLSTALCHTSWNFRASRMNARSGRRCSTRASSRARVEWIFWSEKSLVVELKVVEALNPTHRAQVISYLQASKLQLGFLINFNVALLKDGLKRVINTIQS